MREWDNLRDAEENYKDSLLTFKTFLGVPDDVALDIRTDEFPEFRKVQLDSEKAVQLAYACRLDLATANYTSHNGSVLLSQCW
jgi:hypothetical protein